MTNGTFVKSEDLENVRVWTQEKKMNIKLLQGDCISPTGLTELDLLNELIDYTNEVLEV